MTPRTGTGRGTAVGYPPSPTPARTARRRGPGGGTALLRDIPPAPSQDEASPRRGSGRAVVVFGGPVPPGFHAWDDVLAGQPDTEPPVPAADAAGGSMIYTSGTTGKPKGALRTTTDPATVYALLAELALRPLEAVRLTTRPLYPPGPLAGASLHHTPGRPLALARQILPP